MQIRKVRVEDVYPDQSNPRADFGDIDALAESFGLTPGRPGEPLNPPVVVEDGGIYRIVDGERRYRAIKRNKLKEMHVVVADDIDEAQSVAMMLATDDKRGLGEVERSRGVQTMLMLGVPVEKVEKVSRRKGLGRVKRAMQAVGDAAEDMSLERLAAIDELADVPGAAERLEKAGEAGWRSERDLIVEEAKAADGMEQLLGFAESHGVEVVDKVPEDMRFTTRLSHIGKYEPPAGAVAVKSTSPRFAYIDIYAAKAADNPEDEAMRARESLMEDALDEYKSSFNAFVASRLYNVRTMPNLAKVGAAKFEDYFGYRLTHAREIFGEFAVDEGRAVVALGLSVMADNWIWGAAEYLCDPDRWPGLSTYGKGFAPHVEAMEAAIKDGWRPAEAAKPVIEALRGMRDAQKEDEDE